MDVRSWIVVGMLTLCATPVAAQTVDGTTVESYERSVRAMVDTLPEADRPVFAKGMMNMIITGYPAAAGVEGLALMSIMPAAVDAAHITLDGVTLKQIMERGRSLADSQAGAADAATNDLATDRQACLVSAVSIENAKVEKGAYNTLLTMTVTNGLGWAVSGLRFEYSVATPGRSVSWLEDDVSLAIAGGIEPGESRTVSTSLFGLPAEAVAPLRADIALNDVADQHKRLFVGGVRVMGWSDEPSDFACP